MIYFLIAAIVIIDFVANYQTKKAFRGHINKTVNGRVVPAPFEAYRRNPELFMKLAKPFLLFSLIEIILFICLIVEVMRWKK